MKRILPLMAVVAVVFGITFWWAALLLVGTRPPAPEQIIPVVIDRPAPDGRWHPVVIPPCPCPQPCPCPGPCPCPRCPGTPQTPRHPEPKEPQR